MIPGWRDSGKLLAKPAEAASWERLERGDVTLAVVRTLVV